MPDLKQFLGEVPDDADRALLDEASRCFGAGANRAAYLTIWLSIAESLRRRFVQAADRDDAAKRIAGKVSELEEQHKSVDLFLVTNAVEYGMVTDGEGVRLRHIYENRCVFGHPYEEAPNDHLVTTAAADGVEIILGRPLQLRHNYLRRQAHRIATEHEFLADDKETVERFVELVADRSFPDLWGWFLREIAKESEAAFVDADEDLIQRRVCWFVRHFVIEHPEILGDWDLVEDLAVYPATLTRVFRDPPTFALLETHPSDIVVNSLTHTVTADGTEAAYRLLESGELDGRQAMQVRESIGSTSLSTLSRSGLPLSVYIDSMVAALKSGNYDTQNSAISVLNRVGAEGVNSLDSTGQELLGRNVMRAAESNAFRAINFLSSLRDPEWPDNFLRGVVLEAFISEQGEVRFKVRQMHRALNALHGLELVDRQALIDELINGVRDGDVTESWSLEEDVEEALAILAKKSEESGLDGLARLEESVREIEIPESE